MQTRRRWLTLGVGGIGTASFLSDLGHEVPTALLPRFITQTLGASPAVLGVIEGVADGLAGFARLVGGGLADDPRRRRGVAVGGYAATAVLTSAIGVASKPVQVAVLRTGGWVARGLRTPARNTLLADAVAPDAYGRAYGFERMLDNLGAIVGPLLAIALVATFDVRTAMTLSVIPGLLAAAAMLYAVRHLPRLAIRERSAFAIRIRPAFQGRLGRLMVAVSLFELGNTAATLLILRATELLTPTRGIESATFVALMLYLAYNVAASLTSLPAGHTSDRLGAERVLAFGVAAFLVAYVVFAFVGPDVLFLLMGFVLAGMGIGAVETAEHAAIAAAAPQGIRGSAFGVLASVQGVGNLGASVGAGLLWALVSPTAAFLTTAILMGISLLRLGASSRSPSR